MKIEKIVLTKGDKRWIAEISSAHLRIAEWDENPNQPLRRSFEVFEAIACANCDTKLQAQRLAQERMDHGWLPVANHLVAQDTRASVVPGSLDLGNPKAPTKHRPKRAFVIDTSRPGISLTAM